MSEPYAAMLATLTPREREYQAELDEFSPRGEHLSAVRPYGGGASVLVCICGYARWFASRELALAMSRGHDRDGVEI